tara:strand:+ start:798 stop:2654 length:1857 start_codon:yes stop_codon:yes gene_type:complete
MPRKQNGFGNATSLAFNKVNKNIGRSKTKGAAGDYPSSREYGSTVKRSVIESYDLNSTWIRWRKGLEFYYQAAWNKLQRLNPNYNPYDETSKKYVDLEINTKLYQGTAGEIDVKFNGYRFATKGSDTSNHYVIKRTPINPPSLGQVNSVLNNPLVDIENKELKEVWARVTPTSQTFMLRNMLGERLTDGSSEASVVNVLTQTERPSVFVGKTLDSANLTTVTITVTKSSLLASSHVIKNGGDINSIIGELGYVKEFYIEQPVNSSYVFEDAESYSDATGNIDYFCVNVDLTKTSVDFEILDQDQEFPTTLIDVTSLTPLYSTATADFSIKGKYFYDKAKYQRFYGKKYLTADVVNSEVTTASFVVLPFTIQSIKEVGTDIEITSVPFTGECKLYAPIGTEATLIFADNSFTKTDLDTDPSGNYYHADERDADGNPLDQWTRIDTDIDPWQQSVFSASQGLTPAVMYSCSCPAHSHAQLRMPQATDSDDTRKVNRQKRYPLPTAQGVNRFGEGALTQVSGMLQSWATDSYKKSYKQCKHSIASRFIERNKTKEPNSYPSVSSRIRFEEKLQKEVQDIPEEFRLSYERSGISTLEVIFSMAEALNMDDAELAYVILNSKF